MSSQKKTVEELLKEGESLLKMGRYEEALKCIDRILEIENLF